MSNKQRPGRVARVDRPYIVHSVRRGASWKFGVYTHHRTRWTAEIMFWLFNTTAGRPTRLIDRKNP